MEYWSSGVNGPEKFQYSHSITHFVTISITPSPMNRRARCCFEISLRPPAFSEFTGQVKCGNGPGADVEAAKKRGDVLELILLSGRPARQDDARYIIANAMGVNIKNTSRR